MILMDFLKVGRGKQAIFRFKRTGCLPTIHAKKEDYKLIKPLPYQISISAPVKIIPVIGLGPNIQEGDGDLVVDILMNMA